MNDGFSLLTMFKLGGIFMWPLLLFSIVTVTIIVERCVYLLCHDLRVDGFRADLSVFLAKGDTETALGWLDARPKRLSATRVFKALVTHAEFGEHLMERAVDAEAGECLRDMEKGLNFLVSLSSLAPLTGFLGTVSGMIGAFKAIAEATEVNAQIVANGIYEALITTVFGLIIAIVAVVGHNLIAQKVDDFTADVEKATTDLIVEAIKRQAAGDLQA
jgi:biopolymer transport protein ExbB